MSIQQSKRWTRAFLYVASIAPDFFIGWPTILVCRLFWGEALGWEDGVLRCRAKTGGWLDRTWGAKWAAVTLSPHAILYMPQRLWPEDRDEPNRTQRHEHVHVEQGEAAQLAAFAEAIVILLVLLIVDEGVWAAVLVPLRLLTGHLVKAGAGYVTAFLRGEGGSGGYGGAYVGSVHEEAARALEDPTHDRKHERT